MRNIFRKPSVMEEVTGDLIKQQQVASAEQMRQRYVDDLSSGVQERIDQALEDLKPKGIILDDPLADTALLAGAGLVAGGGIGAAASGHDEQDEWLKKAKELGMIIH
jgi:hypothetical protein